jgi:hypothetical protein
MKKKLSINKYLRWKRFSFDLKFSQCFFLVLIIFLSIVFLSILFSKLENKYKLNDSSESIIQSITYRPNS